MSNEQNPTAEGGPLQRGVRPAGWVRPNGQPYTSGVAHFGEECPPGWIGAAVPVYSRDDVDRLNAERLDLALLVGRLIHRMRAARDGRGHMAGDVALAEKAVDYLRRKGLTSPLREGPNDRIQPAAVAARLE